MRLINERLRLLERRIGRQFGQPSAAFVEQLGQEGIGLVNGHKFRDSGAFRRSCLVLSTLKILRIRSGADCRLGKFGKDHIFSGNDIDSAHEFVLL